jgi:L-asparaginase II
MTNPVLVEVTRGGRVESRHRGGVAVLDVHGKAVLVLGDVEEPVFPRSAVKAIQALPLVESGAADQFGFHERELALAQASHGGEPAHVAGVSAMLAALELGEPALECGAHPPSHTASAAELVRRGKAPSQLHNNCSGKHAGFLAVAKQLGVDHEGYVTARHPVQQAVREALESVTGAPHAADLCGTDGCSIPTYAVPLQSLARGFARFVTGVELKAQRAEAARRIYEAAIAEPFLVAGTGRFDTEVMTMLKGAALVKAGAEGVFCAGIAGLGLGVVVKCDDGAGRAAEAMLAAVLARLMREHADAFSRWMHAPVVTRRGAKAGEVRAVASAFQSRG